MDVGTKIVSELITLKVKEMRLASKFNQKYHANAIAITLAALTAIIAVNRT